MTTRRPPRAFRVFAQRRTWTELLWGLTGVFQGVFGLAFTLVTLTAGIGLSVTFIGLPLLAATGLVSRWLGDGARRGANAFAGADVPPPPPFTPRPGLFGWISSALRDTTAWRARLYLVLKFPISVVTFVLTVLFWSYGLGGLTYAIWQPFLPCQHGPGERVCHDGVGIAPHVYLDTPFRIVLTTIAGALVLLAAPWVVRAAHRIDRLAVAALLGPTDRDARVVELERSRASAVDDSAATLRRIERDLHDGAQARMVAVAMTVGLAREKLAEGADPEAAGRLLDAAHDSAKQAITELRDLARGIHPPVLDTGLGPALQTLAASSGVPVDLHLALDGRQDPAIETMAYFCVAELLTNVAKHAGATRVDLNAMTSGPWLRLIVSDDGGGGARVGAGSGLSGLAERVRTVDGTLAVRSPDGGPTIVTVDVPLRTSATDTRQGAS